MKRLWTATVLIGSMLALSGAAPPPLNADMVNALTDAEVVDLLRTVSQARATARAHGDEVLSRRLALDFDMLMQRRRGVAVEDAPDEADAAAGETAPTLHIVERGDLTLRIERHGRIDSHARAKVRIAPEAYNGTLEIAEVMQRGGQVQRGDVLVRLRRDPIDDAIRSSRESLDEQRMRLGLAAEEREVLAEANALRREQAELALADAQSALEVWMSYTGPGMLESATLNVRGREFSTQNQRQELEQLEKMYEGVELASETKDIVLQRARRSLELSEGWLRLAHNDYVVTTEFTYPQRQRQATDAVRFRAAELAHLQINTRIAELRKEQEIDSLTRAIRDGEERLAKLEADADRFAIRAPAAGVMPSVDLQPGDTISSRQVITEIIDLDALVVRFAATPADLRVLRVGEQVPVLLADYPELSLSGKVIEIDEVGKAAGDDTHFPVLVALDNPDPLARAGLRATVTGARTLPDEVLVPKKAVRFERGQAFVNVRDPGDEPPRARVVMLGASDDEQYQVVAGLEPGELVVVPEE
jgi:hypothetical protein